MMHCLFLPILDWSSLGFVLAIVNSASLITPVWLLLYETNQKLWILNWRKCLTNFNVKFQITRIYLSTNNILKQKSGLNSSNTLVLTTTQWVCPKDPNVSINWIRLICFVNPVKLRGIESSWKLTTDIRNLDIENDA